MGERERKRQLQGGLEFRVESLISSYLTLDVQVMLETIECCSRTKKAAREQTS